MQISNANLTYAQKEWNYPKSKKSSDLYSPETNLQVWSYEYRGVNNSLGGDANSASVFESMGGGNYAGSGNKVSACEKCLKIKGIKCPDCFKLAGHGSDEVPKINCPHCN